MKKRREKEGRRNVRLWKTNKHRAMWWDGRGLPEDMAVRADVQDGRKERAGGVSRGPEVRETQKAVSRGWGGKRGQIPHNNPPTDCLRNTGSPSWQSCTHKALESYTWGPGPGAP